MFNNKKSKNKKEKKSSIFALPEEAKRLIWSGVMFLAAIITVLSFFDLAGAVGSALKQAFIFLIGNAFFAVPLVFVFGGLAFLNGPWVFKKIRGLSVLVASILIFGITGVFATFELSQRSEILENFIWNYAGEGGWLGYIISWILFKSFGFVATLAMFSVILIVGGVILFKLSYQREKMEDKSKKQEGEKEETEPLENKKKPSFIKKILAPSFKIKEKLKEKKIAGKDEPLIPQDFAFKKEEFRIEPIKRKKEVSLSIYKVPSLDLLTGKKSVPESGNIKVNSAIIQRTLQNFNIPVEMSGVNIGPTVTQYTLKPAEGVKLSKITTLSNDLSLALAAHPIRIEAPIPGRSLIGIEIPNRRRAMVTLRSLIESPQFQNSPSLLTLVLGEDVAGFPVFADLTNMPHLLVAGSTGSGKTVCLNNIILSLLYKAGPENLRLILVDPKRVEFSAYNNLPHLLCPVIYNSSRTVSVLKWLIGEMDKRFEIFSKAKSKDIISYNEGREEIGEIMPYIVLIIDELADLMMRKGRDIEASIVRLAQMARAVGIHLIVATQRPSVEVITGLIKANITSRIAFQTASQVDSRTILDMSGAEKLLGAGDLLFLSPDIGKPRRIQGAYIGEKEIRKVANWLASEAKNTVNEEDLILESELSKDLQDSLEKPSCDDSSSEEDPLYEEAKKIVIEARKASASLFQRRLRIGYARAARLIDVLEDRGIVGPGEGAKPREVYLKSAEDNDGFSPVEETKF